MPILFPAALQSIKKESKLEEQYCKKPLSKNDCLRREYLLTFIPFGFSNELAVEFSVFGFQMYFWNDCWVLLIGEEEYFVIQIKGNFLKFFFGIFINY